MPTGTNANPLAGQNQFPYIAQYLVNVALDPTITAGILAGTLVEIEAFSGVNTGDVGGSTGPSSTYTPPYVQPSATTADFYLLGIAVGGSTLGNSVSGYTAGPLVAAIPGGIVQVCVFGICQALFDAHNTTAAHVATQSVTTAGTCLDASSAVASKTVGTVLQTVTISSGTALVNLLARLS